MKKIESLLDLADFLDNLPPEGAEVEGRRLGFDMSLTFYEVMYSCISACCIGGWVQALREDLAWGDEGELKEIEDSLMDLHPGMSENEADDICYPGYTHGAYDATPQQAASLLRHYHETGEVDWPRALGQKENAQ